ncbi:MAG: HAD-IA family hydrolase [Alicyclobacillus sp.]|nr:HAD-IA family hydrolase [Alicyclobacillus sp.]
MASFEVIFFDLDHTLVDTRRQYALGMVEALERLYGDEVPADFIPNFMRHHEQLWSEYDKRLITMKDLRRERFLRAWRDLGVERQPEEAEAFQCAFDATYEHTLFPYDGVHEMLAALAQDHRLGIITNGSPDLQWRKMGITGLQPYFREQDVIISEQIGEAKPHPSVFAAACERLGVDKGAALMIGDNYRSDVLGARNFGMEALWFVPDPQMAQEALQLGIDEMPIRDSCAVVTRVGALEAARD